LIFIIKSKGRGSSLRQDDDAKLLLTLDERHDLESASTDKIPSIEQNCF
jgi:hypothetical protein